MCAKRFYDKSWKGCIEEVLEQLQLRMYTPVAELDCELFWSKEPLPFAQRRTGVYRKLKIGESWGELFDCGWFRFRGRIPDGYTPEELVIRIDLSGEGLLVDEDGTPVIGLTNLHCVHDPWWGCSAKREIPAKLCVKDGRTVDIWVDGGCNDLVGGYADNGVLALANISVVNETVIQLYYDLEVLYDAWGTLEPETARARRLFQIMKDAVSVLAAYSPAELEKAHEILLPALEAHNGFAPVTLVAVGHAHLDLAWLWPERETVRKGARTFSTALRMMERYPDYIFGASQALLYQWMKDRYPGLYAQIREQIAKGRWDIQGAMWVEADTNLSGGEALIRQIVYGKAFFRKEFHKDVRVLWLPDVFGYTAALPQILKKCDVPYFFTNKLSMNTNRLPHHNFHWQGIDGSRVLVHMTPADDYASKVRPQDLIYAQDHYRDAGICDEALLLFGRSDGGGGAGREHLERLKRLKNFDQLPPVRTGTVQEFYDRLAEKSDRLATWCGELYFEYHQGTLTSQARTKQQNRRAETAVRNAEILCTMAARETGAAYPAKELERIWKRILFLQFHDILPGSGIARVYEEAETEYAVLLGELEEITRKAAAALGCGSLNLTSAPYRGWEKRDGRWYRVTAAPFATVARSAQEAVLEGFENDSLRVTFTEDGAIASVYDKEAMRELLRPGCPANRFAVYPDDADAWELPVEYWSRAREYFTLTKTELITDGPQAIRRSEYRYGDSVIRQDVILTADERELRFVTTVDWRETKKMLRTGFAVAMACTEAVCGIQFGQLNRPTHDNTPWDAEKFEICAPRYVDLAEAGYGVSVMSDSKYGYSIRNNRLDICLLRSPMWPGENADKGVHTFTYTLYPHMGNTVDGGVAAVCEHLNRPPVACGGDKALAPYIQIDAPTVMVEAMKQAEDGDGYILRVYESSGLTVRAGIRIKGMQRCVLTDMLEDPLMTLPVCGEAVSLRFGPYEIHTLRFN